MTEKEIRLKILEIVNEIKNTKLLFLILAYAKNIKKKEQ